METEVITRLIELNRQFYQTFAVQFALTRQRLQPGVRRVLESIPPDKNILDLGCGNGELARRLAQRGHAGVYLGVDFSPGLLSASQSDPLPPNFTFRQVDLTRPGWSAALGLASFDLALAFAVLHHLPASGVRQQVLTEVRAVLPAGGQFIHSNWQFLNSPRLAQRIQPWETIGLSPAQLEPGDYLLDWRHGGRGLRYVHHFSASELEGLAAAVGFDLCQVFASDGEGGNLGLYMGWEAR